MGNCRASFLIRASRDTCRDTWIAAEVSEGSSGVSHGNGEDDCRSFESGYLKQFLLRRHGALLQRYHR